MTTDYLDFEKPLFELERKIEELRRFTADGNSIDIKEDITKLEKKAHQLRVDIFSNLTPWQKVQLARHPNRPYALDYINLLTEDFLEMHGDRSFGDDAAIVGGIAKFRGESVVVIGHQKGRNIKERVFRNFGQPNPEGYRKALRLMKFAARFGKPIITFIDTPGAYPGIGAEERGQGEAIARNLLEMAALPVPIISVVTGEGGSGGALALGVADRVLMLQFSVYSVISPEGCSAILWNDGSRAAEAADLLKMTSENLKAMDLADEVITEPLGGAHHDYQEVAKSVGDCVFNHLQHLKTLSTEKLLENRYQKFRTIGAYTQ
ncbi:MAG: acetyl-CoA carboxylase carboxyltransferase subunit alpha [Nitrospirota bacterium]|nr:acetyl-CoA carboxylase carboxyltransferase subunit alpha [Nitrospirota bacterium]